MSHDEPPEVRLALLEHRVSSLEADRAWVKAAAIGAAGWLAMQLLPLVPQILKGLGK